MSDRDDGSFRVSRSNPMSVIRSKGIATLRNMIHLILTKAQLVVVRCKKKQRSLMKR